MLAELARHFVAAAPIAPVDKAVYYARRAAAQAARSAAHDEATSHLAAALALGPPPVERARVLVDLAHRGAADGRCTRRAATHSREAFDLARTPVTRPSRPRRRCCSSWRRTSRGCPGGPAVELLRQAIALTGDGTAPLQVRLQASLGRALAIEGRNDEAAALIALAVGRAREIGDAEALLVGLQAVVTSSDDPATVHAAARRARRPGRRSARTSGRSPTAAVNQCRAEITVGDLAGAARSLERLRAATASGRFSMFGMMAVHVEAILAMADGDLDRAEAFTEQAFAMDAIRTRARSAPACTACRCSPSAASRAGWPRSRPVVRLLAAATDPPPIWRPGLTALYAELGMLDEARRAVRRPRPGLVRGDPDATRCGRPA